jgi:hypothetical protein
LLAATAQRYHADMYLPQPFQNWCVLPLSEIFQHLNAAVQLPFLILWWYRLPYPFSSSHLLFLYHWTGGTGKQVRYGALPTKDAVRCDEGSGGVGGTAIPLIIRVTVCLLGTKKVRLISRLRIKSENGKKIFREIDLKCHSHKSIQ